MSAEQLTADYQAIQQKIDALSPALTTNMELVNLLKNEIGPFMGSIVNETCEIDAAVQDMYWQSDDILQPETSGVFATLILAGRALAAELAKRAAGDAKVTGQIKAFLELAKACEGTLEEITVDDTDREDDDDDDEDDEEDDDEDEAPALPAANGNAEVK